MLPSAFLLIAMPSALQAPARPAPRSITLTVRVKDISGDPLAAVKVTLTPPPTSPAPPHSGTTDAQGAAGFTLAPGRYRLRAEKEGHRPETLDLDLDGSRPTVELRLVRTP